MEKAASLQKRRALPDLIVIVVITMAVLGIFIANQDAVESFARDPGIHILLRTAGMALLQFGTAGLGISLVSIIRRESFAGHGLRRDNALKSVVFCALAFVPNIIFGLAAGQIDSYLPFGAVWMSRELLGGNFAVGAAGYVIIALAWGFFEGFNYVVICDKINKLIPVKHRWLNWGAIICGVMCILIHGMIGVTPEGIIEMLTVFIIIYGMLVTKTETGNAWGCVFVFVFLWNAF
jgi:hypothetical protein